MINDACGSFSRSSLGTAAVRGQIDEGFLGKVEVGVEIALERAEKLAAARTDLRREFEELVECAHILPAVQ
jgi:hypothetical protein